MLWQGQQIHPVAVVKKGFQESRRLIAQAVPSRDKELSKAFTRTLQNRGGKGARGKQ